MVVIDTKSYDPYINLATEEFLFRNFSEEILFLYINSPSVIIGKHQNAYEEVNLGYIKKERIPVIRRISGGGTVFHDMGNLNFTFIKNRNSGEQVNFVEYTRPVVSFLKIYGLNPYLGEKNEIREDGWKFSGNAEHVFKNRVLHHGTLLFSSKLEDLGDALKPGTGTYRSRAVKSNRTNVGNLSSSIPNFKDIYQLKDELTQYITENIEHSFYSFSASDIDSIDRLIKEKYRSDSWNFGYGPDYTFTNRFRFENSDIVLEMSVKKGLISEISIEGDTMLNSILQNLVGVEHLPDTVEKVLKLHFPGIGLDTLFNFFN